MAENSKIEWTTHTFNPWRGCTRVSEGCRHCYAETLSGRNPKTLGVWGPNGTRVVLTEAGWRDPIRWNRLAAEAGERHRVFCASLADVFEDWSGPMMAANGNPMWWCHGSLSNSPIPAAWGGKLEDGCRLVTMDDIRVRLLELIADTPHLDWLLLTKRPELVRPTLARPRVRNSCPLADRWHSGEAPANVWLGTTVENQAAADARIPHLLATPAVVRFLSCEPLLGPVDLDVGRTVGGDPEYVSEEDDALGSVMGGVNGIDWVIVGGESGPGARPMQLEWARSLRDQCAAAEVACFVKQLGGTPESDDDADAAHSKAGTRFALNTVLLADKKGGDIEEWPADLRVREFPAVRA